MSQPVFGFAMPISDTIQPANQQTYCWSTTPLHIDLVSHSMSYFSHETLLDALLDNLNENTRMRTQDSLSARGNTLECDDVMHYLLP